MKALCVPAFVILTLASAAVPSSPRITPELSQRATELKRMLTALLRIAFSHGGSRAQGFWKVAGLVCPAYALSVPTPRCIWRALFDGQTACPAVGQLRSGRKCALGDQSRSQSWCRSEARVPSPRLLVHG
jgi:hypothetical protein